MKKVVSNQRQNAKVERAKAFADVLGKGTSSSYLKYLDDESKENRIIEKNL